MKEVNTTIQTEVIRRDQLVDLGALTTVRVVGVSVHKEDIEVTTRSV